MSDGLEARGHHAITHDGESYIKLIDASVTFSVYRKDIAAKDAQITRLNARVAELEHVLRAKVTEIERAYPHEGHCIECHGVVRAWGNTEHRDDCWYVKARATLERKER